jgi:solute:Na+ symporter, SSS family
VMSTASSYLNSIAVVFTKDIYEPLAGSSLAGARRLWLERALSVVVGIGATVFAVSAPSIVDALLYSYALWAPTVIIPLLAAVLFGVRSRPAALGAIIAGGLVTAVWTWGLDEPFQVTGLMAGVITNLVVFVALLLVPTGRRPASSEPSSAAPVEVS